MSTFCQVLKITFRGVVSCQTISSFEDVTFIDPGKHMARTFWGRRTRTSQFPMSSPHTNMYVPIKVTRPPSAYFFHGAADQDQPWVCPNVGGAEEIFEMRS